MTIELFANRLFKPFESPPALGMRRVRSSPDAVATPHEAVADAVFERDDTLLAWRPCRVSGRDAHEGSGLRIGLVLQMTRRAIQGVGSVWITSARMTMSLPTSDINRFPFRVAAGVMAKAVYRRPLSIPYQWTGGSTATSRRLNQPRVSCAATVMPAVPPPTTTT